LVPQAQPIVEQYVEFIRITLGLPVPSAIKLASAATIARRNERRDVPWDFTEFLNEAERHGGSDLVAAHQSLLDLLTAMEDVEPRFESKGGKDATYTIHLAKSDIGQLAWIHADGRLCPCWASFRKSGDTAAAERMRKVWAPYVKKPDNAEFSYTKDTLGVLTPEHVSELFQRSVEPEAGRPATA
jgi:hypothetical protein